MRSLRLEIRQLYVCVALTHCGDTLANIMPTWLIQLLHWSMIITLDSVEM